MKDNPAKSLHDPLNQQQPSMISSVYSTPSIELTERAHTSNKLAIRKADSMYEKQPTRGVIDEQIIDSEHHMSNNLLQLILSIRQSLYVSIFLKKLKALSRSYLFRRMDRRSFDVISDTASNYDYFVTKGLIESKRNRGVILMLRRMRWRRFYLIQLLWGLEGLLFNCFRRLFFTINPRSRIKLIWDSFIYMFLVVNIFYVPVQLAWEDSRSQLSTDYYIIGVILGDIPGWAFLIDIVLNFFTSYYDEGRLITKRRLIVMNYLRKQFWVDILVTLPFLINQYVNIRFLNVILLLRLRNMLRRQATFEELVDFSPNSQLMYDFCKIVVTIVFLAHFVGCFYFLLGSIEDSMNIGPTWISYYQISGSFTSQYIASLYWATITMVTIGYGDISPQTQYERIFVLFVALIGCCYFAAIISSIGSIVQTWNQRAQDKRKRISILIQYLKKRGVNKQLQFKVKKQIAYAYERDEEYSNEAVEILQSLSIPLQKDIELDILLRVLRSIKFIQNRYSEPFLQHLIKVLKPRICEPGELVIDNNAVNESIYCVLNGQLRFELDVNAYFNVGNSQVLQHYDKLDTFGDYCFLSGNVHKGKVVSVSPAQLMVLEKSAFEDVIRLYPKDFELYRMQVDQIQIDSSFKHASRHCQICSSSSHFFFDCPVSTLKLYQPKVIIDKDPPQQQKRTSYFYRTFHHKKSTFALLEHVQKAGIQYILNYDLAENVRSIEAIIGSPLEQSQQQSQQQSEEQQIQSESMIASLPPVSPKKKPTQAPFRQFLKSKTFQQKVRNSLMRNSIEFQTPANSKQLQEEKKEFLLLLQGQVDACKSKLNKSISQIEEEKEEDFSDDGVQTVEQEDKELHEALTHFTCIPDFDAQTDFNVYFPLGNYANISEEKQHAKFFVKRIPIKTTQLTKKLMLLRNVNLGSSILNSKIRKQVSRKEIAWGSQISFDHNPFSDDRDDEIESEQHNSNNLSGNHPRERKDDVTNNRSQKSNTSSGRGDGGL